MVWVGGLGYAKTYGVLVFLAVLELLFPTVCVVGVAVFGLPLRLAKKRYWVVLLLGAVSG